MALKSIVASIRPFYTDTLAINFLYLGDIVRRVQSTLFALLAASGQVNAMSILPMSESIYTWRMTILWVSIVAGIGVFFAMFYAMYRYRKPDAKYKDMGWVALSCMIMLLMAVPVIQQGFAMKVVANQEKVLVPQEKVVVSPVNRFIRPNSPLPTTPTPVPVARPLKVVYKTVSEADPLKAAIHRGQVVYAKKCAVCHQLSGEGVPPIFPALKDNDMATGSVDDNIDRVMNGKPGTAMQAFKQQLNDQQIADVITYERNAWGNDTGDLIKPSQIAAARKTKP